MSERRPFDSEPWRAPRSGQAPPRVEGCPCSQPRRGRPSNRCPALILCRAMARVRLHSLSLAGFKSFPDKVDLGFPSDISAIIGPNGCGKSNLVDAILWVLGEQSPTLLRLKQMGEVVFSGATRRAPAGAAEVVLTLQSDDGHWKEADGRLEVRRRVYRSGPSEYRLNGKTARLKDVMDELMSVGLGIRDYSIIEQGRVGQVLSARPTDRRILHRGGGGHHPLQEAQARVRAQARAHPPEPAAARRRDLRGRPHAAPAQAAGRPGAAARAPARGAQGRAADSADHRGPRRRSRPPGRCPAPRPDRERGRRGGRRSRQQRGRPRPGPGASGQHPDRDRGGARRGRRAAGLARAARGLPRALGRPHRPAPRVARPGPPGPAHDQLDPQRARGADQRGDRPADHARRGPPGGSRRGRRGHCGRGRRPDPAHRGRDPGQRAPPGAAAHDLVAHHQPQPARRARARAGPCRLRARPARARARDAGSPSRRVGAALPGRGRGQPQRGQRRRGARRPPP